MRSILSPDRIALLRRAIASAIAIPIAFFVGDELVGGSAVAVFAVFGGFSVLVFARFSGDRVDQAVRYVGLGVAGYVTITLGSLLADPSWLAALSMLVVGTAITLAGVLSAAAAGAGRALLLTFILPLVVPGGVSVIPDRLMGWTIALAICVPTAIVLLPAHDRRILRRGIRGVCEAIARVLAGLREGTGDIASAIAGVRQGADGLRAAIESPATRPIGPSARSRSLIRTVPLLEATADLLDIAPAPPVAWDEAERTLLVDSEHVLHSLAVGPLSARPEIPVDRATISRTETDLRAAMVTALRGRSGTDVGRTPWLVGIATNALATVRTLDPSARAGHRQRPLPPLHRVVRSDLRLESVSFRNALRVGLALAIAVFVAKSLPFENAFWVVLATLTALSTNRVGTAASATRAVLGTLIGFVASVLVFAVVGESTVTLWLLLPVTVLLACFAPAAISFTAGQAAFTVAVVVIFEIVNPTVTAIGLARVEDVIAGSIIALIVSASLWPHGAGRVADRFAADALRASAEYLARTMDALLHGTVLTDDELESVTLTVRRFDDARRQFRLERGADTDRLARLVAVDDTVLCLVHCGDEILALGSLTHPDRLAGTREALVAAIDRVLHGGQPTPDEGATQAFVDRLRTDSTGLETLDDAERLATAWIWVRHVQRFLLRRHLPSIDAAAETILVADSGAP
jgi:uncharacterized membrane protein YccC